MSPLFRAQLRPQLPGDNCRWRRTRKHRGSVHAYDAGNHEHRMLCREAWVTDVHGDASATPELTVSLGDDYVATLEFSRPPSNFFSVALISQIADACAQLAADGRCRAIVLCSSGRVFCAGADFAGAHAIGTPDGTHLYDHAVRLFQQPLPVVAAVQGAAIGGGLGLAMAADFRVAAPEARFAANFARLGFHHGFGLTVTLPAVVGRQHALELLYTGRRPPGGGATHRPVRPPGAGRGPARGGAGAGGRDRRLRAAGGPVDPRDHARRPGRAGARGARPGAGRAGAAEPDGRLPRGRPGHGRTPGAQLHGALIEASA